MGLVPSSWPKIIDLLVLLRRVPTAKIDPGAYVEHGSTCDRASVRAGREMPASGSYRSRCPLAGTVAMALFRLDGCTALPSGANVGYGRGREDCRVGQDLPTRVAGGYNRCGPCPARPARGRWSLNETGGRAECRSGPSSPSCATAHVGALSAGRVRLRLGPHRVATRIVFARPSAAVFQPGRRTCCRCCAAAPSGASAVRRNRSADPAGPWSQARSK